MRWLIFLSRVAFLCGIMAVLAFSLLIFDWNSGEKISSTIITSGYSLGLVILPIVNSIYFIVWIFGKKPGKLIPGWMLISNIFFLLLILFYIFYLNDPYYHQ